MDESETGGGGGGVTLSEHMYVLATTETEGAGHQGTCLDLVCVLVILPASFAI